MKNLKSTFLSLVAASMMFASCAGKEEKAEQAQSSSAKKDYELTYEEAKRLVNNYERHAGNVEGSKGSKVVSPNTRAIWISADRLLELANDVKKQNGDGIRFYLATYDKIGSGKNASAKAHLGYNTLVLVSTFPSEKYGQKIHQDYYSDKPGQNGGKGFIVGNPPQNRGEMCPPPNTCDSVGADLVTYPTPVGKL